MSGAASRSKGHRAELAVVNYLKARGYSDAATTRSRLGHDGFHAPGDVVAIPGLVIEVKDVASSAWPSWCRQAADEAEGRPWVVIRKVRGVGDPGRWYCAGWIDFCDHAVGPASVNLQPFAAWLDWWESDDVAASGPVGEAET